MRQKPNQLSVFETACAGLVKVKELIFFASALLQTKFVEDPTCDTAWTDMVVIGYNPAFIEGLDVPTAKFVIIHELMHKLLKHGLRRMGRDLTEWNNACDYAINIMLQDLGFKVWQHALIDPQYRGMSAEQIYALQQQGGKQPAFGQGGPEQGGLGGDLRPVPAPTPEKAAAIEHEINKTIARATVIAREHGVMLSGLEAIIGATYEDPVSWEDVLVDYTSRCLAEEENWSRRNRRYSEVILPSRKSDGMDELVVIADSSGSMFSKEVFERIAVAINYVVTVIKPLTTRVVWADNRECSNVDVFEPGDLVVLHPKGGGGTDMTKPLKFVEQYQPEVCLLFTDAATPWPQQATPFPLIIGCTTDLPCPDWAAVVRIEVGQ
jgi:predicted metal-dependent peptidase